MEKVVDKQNTQNASDQSKDKKFNVLHVISKLPVGGVENMLVKVIERYDKKRFNISVCCINEKGKIAEDLIASGYSVEVLNRMKKNKFDPNAIVDLYKLMKKNNIHILRTHMFHANLYGRIAGVFAGVPVIITSSHDVYRSPDEPKMHRRVLNYILSFFTDAMVAVSEGIASDIITYDKVKPQKVCVIHNGIALEKFNAGVSRQEARKRFRLPEDGVIIGTVGRLTDQKGHRYLIQAASKTGGMIAIAGSGPLMEELEDLAKQTNVHCLFLGGIDPEKIPVFLKALDIFCFPSLWEGLPSALIEAMATGIPIAASDIPSHREVMDDAGLFFAPGNSEALAGALRRLLNTPSLRNSLGQKAKTVSARFSIDNTVKAYEGIFEKMLKKKGLL